MSLLAMEKRTTNQTFKNENHIFNSGSYGRLTCGIGPDDEPESFQVTVRGLMKRGNSENRARKITEACYKHLVKL